MRTVSKKFTECFNAKFNTSHSSILTNSNFTSVLSNYNSNSNNYNEVILNNPSCLNAIDYDMGDYIVAFLQEKTSAKLDFNEKRDVLLLKGNGKAFSSGGNIVKLVENGFKKNDLDFLKAVTSTEQDLCLSLNNLPSLQISFWHGAVMGLGVGTSINSKIKISTESTNFAMPEAKIGFYTDAGASFFLTRMIPNHPEIGLYLGLTSKSIKGKEVFDYGISDYFIPEELNNELYDKLKSFLDSKNTFNSMSRNNEELNEKSLLIHDFLKENCQYNKDKTISYINHPGTIKLNNHSQNINENTINYPNEDLISYIFRFDSIFNVIERINEIEKELSCLSKNNQYKVVDTYIAAIVSSYDNNQIKEKLEWVREVKNIIVNERSPNSIITIFELLKKGFSFRSFNEAIEFEHKLTLKKYAKDNDFHEGIRALLIDKDNKPKWESKSIKDVDYDSLMNEYFF